MTPAAASPRSSSGGLSGNLRHLHISDSSGKGQSPRPRAMHPWTKSPYLELEVDGNSTSLASLCPGWKHIDDLGNRGRWWGGIQNGHNELLESKAQIPQPGWGHQQNGTFLQGNLSDSYHAAGDCSRWPKYPAPFFIATARPYSLNSIQLW